MNLRLGLARFAGVYLCLLAISLLVGRGDAASTQVWEISEYKDFLGGKFDNISLRHDGRLVPAPRLKTVFSSEQPIVWSAATAPDGSIYLGTGHQGHVYRVEPNGKSKLFWKAPEVEVFTIAVAPDGILYAGTSPQGKVYRLAKNGEAEVVFDPKETYIWSLVFPNASDGKDGFGGAGALFVGTGDQGKIYRVTADGKGEIYYETGQRHVVSLALDREGLLLVGTDPNGILYRVEAKGKAFALYDSDLPEIRELEVGPEGEIYAAAMGGGASQMTQSVPSGAFSTSTAGAGVTISVSPGGGPSLDKAKTGQAATVAPQASVSIVQPVISYAGMEKAALLRVGSDLSVRKLWSSKEENLLALRQVEFGDFRLLFATDRRGRIYGLNSDRDVTLVAEVDQEQVTQLLAGSAGLSVTTAHSGKLFRLEPGRAGQGTYESPAHDAGSVSRWGRISWRATGPEGAVVEFQTRCGNAARPDATWSDWSEPTESRPGASTAAWTSARIQSPPARYLQWRATLRGSGDVGLNGVRVAYLPQNQAPVIDSIEVTTAAPTDTASSTAATAASADAASSSAAFSITVTDTGEVTTGDSKGTKAKTVRGGASQRLKVAWKAYDPDSDELTAEVKFRGEGEATWKTIKKDVKEKELSIDSDALADGVYRFRVEVSDGRANPPDQALSTRRVSEPVVIDHTPPAVRLAGSEGRSSLRFEVEDQASMLQHAEYSIDAGPWVPVRADDGIADSPTETFTIRLEDLQPGEHLITLRVRDRTGNAGLGKAIVP